MEKKEGASEKQANKNIRKKVIYDDRMKRTDGRYSSPGRPDRKLFDL